MNQSVLQFRLILLHKQHDPVQPKLRLLHSRRPLQRSQQALRYVDQGKCTHQHQAKRTACKM